MHQLQLNDRRTDHVVAGIKFQPDIPVEVSDLRPFAHAIRRHELLVLDAEPAAEANVAVTTPRDEPNETKSEPRGSSRRRKATDENKPADTPTAEATDTKPTE